MTDEFIEHDEDTEHDRHADAVERAVRDEHGTAVAQEHADALRWTLPRIDAALDAARVIYGAASPYRTAEITHLIHAAEAMRIRLYGRNRDDVDPMPVFVLRASDNLAAPVVEEYRARCELYGLTDQADEVHEAVNEFTEWQSRNPGRLKNPDHRHIPALPTARDKAALLGRLFEQDTTHVFPTTDADVVRVPATYDDAGQPTWAVTIHHPAAAGGGGGSGRRITATTPGPADEPPVDVTPEGLAVLGMFVHNDLAATGEAYRAWFRCRHCQGLWVGAVPGLNVLEEKIACLTHEAQCESRPV